MDDVAQRKLWMPEMMLSSFPSKFSSNSAKVASAWPLTRKKAMSVSASPSFEHYEIIHALHTSHNSQVYKIKINIPARITECQL
jgi:hypothetical protein